MPTEVHTGGQTERLGMDAPQGCRWYSKWNVEINNPVKRRVEKASFAVRVVIFPTAIPVLHCFSLCSSSINLLAPEFYI